MQTHTWNDLLIANSKHVTLMIVIVKWGREHYNRYIPLSDLLCWLSDWANTSRNLQQGWHWCKLKENVDKMKFISVNKT